MKKSKTKKNIQTNYLFGIFNKMKLSGKEFLDSKLVEKILVTLSDGYETLLFH